MRTPSKDRMRRLREGRRAAGCCAVCGQPSDEYRCSRCQTRKHRENTAIARTWEQVATEFNRRNGTHLTTMGVYVAHNRAMRKMKEALMDLLRNNREVA